MMGTLYDSQQDWIYKSNLETMPSFSVQRNNIDNQAMKSIIQTFLSADIDTPTYKFDLIDLTRQ